MGQDEYSAFIQQLKELRGRVRATRQEKDDTQTELMLLLVELHAMEALWRPHHKSFRALLKTEQLCSIGSFEYFERGIYLLSIEEAERYGHTALRYIAIVPAVRRDQLIAGVRAWYASQEMPPTKQEVAQWVRKQSKKLAPAHERLSRKALESYVALLKAQLKKAGIQPEPISKVQ